MSGLLPSDSEAKLEDEEKEKNGVPNVVFLDDEEADDLVSTLYSENARAILRRLHDDPATVSELADEIGTSLQNTHHHLNNLREAGLIQVKDTRYSSKGREMNVYAPSDQPLVMFVGKEKNKTSFMDALKRFVAVFGILAAMSVVIQVLFGDLFRSVSGSGGPTPPPGGLPDSIDPISVGQMSQSVVADLLSAGSLFFAGGAVVLMVVGAWWYWEQRSGQ